MASIWKPGMSPVQFLIYFSSLIVIRIHKVASTSLDSNLYDISHSSCGLQLIPFLSQPVLNIIWKSSMIIIGHASGEKINTLLKDTLYPILPCDYLVHNLLNLLSIHICQGIHIFVFALLLASDMHIKKNIKNKKIKAHEETNQQTFGIFCLFYIYLHFIIYYRNSSLYYHVNI